MIIEKYYIFGAHPRGYTMYQYLRTLKPEKENLGFLFDNEEKNPEEIEGVKVYDLKTITSDELDTEAIVYLATRGIFHEHIKEALINIGFSRDNIIPVTPSLDMDLRNKYVQRVFANEGRVFEKLIVGEASDSANVYDSNLPECCVYVAKTVFDKDFSKEVPLKKFESIIQAGTGMTEDRLPDAEAFDNDGENISSKNKQFCELTALYWIWKHAAQDIIGLEHWRRRFLLPDNWIELFQKNRIDVILPVPLCVMPSLEENYRGRHVSEVWDRAMKILEELHPEDAEPAERYFKEHNLYSPCNMMIARKDIMTKYCSWLFPVLLRLNEEIGNLDDAYQNRYPGFLSERLLNYYLEAHRDTYQIVYADKSFLS